MKDAFVKNPLSAQSAVASSITAAFMEGRVPLPPQLLNHACLSMAALTDLLNEEFEKAELPMLKGTLALARAEHLYATVRELKHFVQGIDAKTLHRYQRTIAETKGLNDEGRHEEAIKYLKGRVKAPHRALVAVAAGLELKNPDYWVHSDRQILDLCAGVPSLTALKNQHCTLHAHLKGRGLETQYLLENPEAINNFYIDSEGRRFFSYPEVVTANYLRLNNVEHLSQYKVPNLPADEPAREADFYLPGAELLIEVSQNHEKGSGTRKENYLARKSLKEVQYERAGYNALFIDTEPFFSHTGFGAVQYVAALQEILEQHGISTSTDFSIGELGYTNNEEKHKLVASSRDELIEFLEAQGVDGLATLKNNFHFYLDVLNLRPDVDSIIEHFRQRGLRNRALNTKATINARLKQYADIDAVTVLIQQHSITSQKEWFAFAVANKDLLRTLRIPSGLPAVYKKLGTWRGWGALWAKQDEQA